MSSSQSIPAQSRQGRLSSFFPPQAVFGGEQKNRWPFGASQVTQMLLPSIMYRYDNGLNCRSLDRRHLHLSWFYTYILKKWSGIKIQCRWMDILKPNVVHHVDKSKTLLLVLFNQIKYISSSS